MFSGRERATKIEQVQTKEEFGSFGDNVYHQQNQNIHQKFQHLFKANLILLANTPTPGQYTDSWPYPVLVRVTTCWPVIFAVYRLNLHQGNIHAIIWKFFRA